MDSITINHTRQLIEKQRVNVESYEELGNMINLHHFIMKYRAHIILIVVHLLVHADALGAHAWDQLIDTISLLFGSLIGDVDY